VVGAVESEVVLKDGSRVHIRPIRPEDYQALIESFGHLSPQTIYQRFFTALPELTSQMAQYLASVDHIKRMALVAEPVDGSQVIGVGRYERTSDPDVVELGLVILDEWQDRGLGRILLREIIRAAARNGIHRFRADVLAENRRMLRLLATEGEISSSRTEAGVTTLFLTN
jgi:RimJ/RimL family protein N-acetyltransferase